MLRAMQNYLNSMLENCGPLSLTIVLGIPNLLMMSFMYLIELIVVVDIVGILLTSVNKHQLSPSS